MALAVANKLAHPIRIGLIVTSSSQRGEGGDDIGMAAGALVAQYRLGLAAPGKATLDIVDDHGNGSGSDAAMKQLVADGVVGVVYASEGDHMRRGLAEAAAAGLPVLLPYAGSAPFATAPDGSKPAEWFTGPTSAQEVAATRDVLAARKLTDSFIFTSGSGAPSVTGLAPTDQIIQLQAGTGLADQVARAAKQIALDTQPVDSVVVFAPSATEAEVVADLQQQAVQLPVLLGEAALSPTFADRLIELEANGQASSAGSFATLGVDAGDLSGTDGAQAFLSGLRLAATDTSLLGLESTQPFSDVGAATADVRSHDAVLALVTATANASAETPAAVTTALRNLTLTSADGAAGPSLDFASSTALPDAAVRQLQSTRQDPGQRAGISQSPVGLWWFGVPGSGQ